MKTIIIGILILVCASAEAKSRYSFFSHSSEGASGVYQGSVTITVDGKTTTRDITIPEGVLEDLGEADSVVLVLTKRFDGQCSASLYKDRVEIAEVNTKTRKFFIMRD